LRAALEGDRVGAVNAQWYVDKRLYGLDRSRQHVDFVHAQGSDVDVEDIGAGRNLAGGFLASHVEAAGLQRGSQLLFAAGIDALSDQYGGPIEANCHPLWKYLRSWFPSSQLPPFSYLSNYIYPTEQPV